MKLAYDFTVGNHLPSIEKGGLAARATIEALLACVKAGAAFEKGATSESEISK
jgi:hypothetical protein